MLQLLEIRALMHKINCYSVSYYGNDLFEFSYDKFRFLELNYFSDNRIGDTQHDFAEILDEKLFIGRDLNSFEYLFD